MNNTPQLQFLVLKFNDAILSQNEIPKQNSNFQVDVPNIPKLKKQDRRYS